MYTREEFKERILNLNKLNELDKKIFLSEVDELYDRLEVLVEAKEIKNIAKSLLSLPDRDVDSEYIRLSAKILNLKRQLKDKDLAIKQLERMLALVGGEHAKANSW